MEENSGKKQLVRLQLQRADLGTLVAGDDLLRRSPIFRALPKPTLELLLAECSARRAPPGTTIVREGEVGTSLFVVVEGEVRLRTGTGGELLELGVARKGDVFGEAEALGGGQRRHSAVAVEAAAIAEIPEERVRQLLGEAPALRKFLEAVRDERAKAHEELDDFLSKF